MTKYISYDNLVVNTDHLIEVPPHFDCKIHLDWIDLVRSFQHMVNFYVDGLAITVIINWFDAKRQYLNIPIIMPSDVIISKAYDKAYNESNTYFGCRLDVPYGFTEVKGKPNYFLDAIREFWSETGYSTDELDIYAILNWFDDIRRAVVDYQKEQ